MTLVLRGITWDHPRGLRPVVAASADWAQKHNDVHVEWATRSLQAFADEALGDLTREYDLIVVDHPQIPRAARENILVKLDDSRHSAVLRDLALQAVGPSHVSYACFGHQFALPIDAAAVVAVSRPDLLPDAPVTWEDVLEFSSEGRMLWPAKPIDAISSFLSIAGNRGVPVGKSSECFIDIENGYAILDTLHRLADSVPSWCLEANPIEVAECLSASDQFCYVPLTYGYTNYARQGFRPHRLQYLDMPAGARGPIGSCLGGAGIAISAFSRHQQEAADLAFWLASGECQRGIYYSSGGQPAHIEAWRDNDINADSLDFFSNTRATLEGACMRPCHEGWIRVQEKIGDVLSQALRRQTNDEDALRMMNRFYVRSFEVA